MIQILRKVNSNKRFLKIYIDTPHGENEQELLVMIPINDILEKEIMNGIKECNYLSYACSGKYCIDTSESETNVYKSLYIKPIK